MAPEPVSDVVIMACTIIEVHGANAGDIAERAVAKARALGLDDVAAEWTQVFGLIQAMQAAQ